MPVQSCSIRSERIRLTAGKAGRTGESGKIVTRENGKNELVSALKEVRVKKGEERRGEERRREERRGKERKGEERRGEERRGEERRGEERRGERRGEEQRGEERRGEDRRGEKRREEERRKKELKMMPMVSNIQGGNESARGNLMETEKLQMDG
ncbi:unnamed protein product [Closterium sp. NIES-54]